MLGLPAMFAKAGWHYALVVLVSMAFVVTEVGLTMAKTLSMIEDRAVKGVTYSHEGNGSVRLELV